MNPEKSKPSADSSKAKKPAGSGQSQPPAGGKKGDDSAAAGAQKLPALFRKIDWLTMGVTTLLIFIGYFLTLAPDVTLEDSGELATGSFYAGVPHPPGYPVWTLYTWFFTVILPFKSVAWRVAVSSAVAGSTACGFLALIVSRGSSMIIEGVAAFKDIDKKVESTICMVSGFVAGMLMGFNGYMWSQSIIVEVYTLSVCSLMGVLGCILRWGYAPHQRRYLYVALFFFGICLTNHMSLLVAAMGIQVAIMCVQPKLGRDMFFINTVLWIAGLILKANHHLPMFETNGPVYAIFNVVGVLSLAGCIYLCILTEGFGSELIPVLIMAGMWCLGAAFYLYMPVASMTNPPMNWGYPRTVDGFWHAISRGQYEAVHPTSTPFLYAKQILIYCSGAIEEFNLVYLCIGLIPFVYFRFMQKREQRWIIGLSAIYACLAFFLLYLLNPGSDRQSLQLNKVFFTASYVMVSIGIGYGVALISATIATQYDKLRNWILLGAAIALALSVYGLGDTISNAFKDLDMNWFALLPYGVKHAFVEHENQLQVFASLLLVGLAVLFLCMVVIFRSRLSPYLVLAVFACMPLHSITGHWFDNEQRGHLFGFWFGHDMFTPPFGIYPEMDRDAILFGGTDPGRFCPTYMIFCESFVKPEDRTEDPKFDRRDVYIITQNALADVTYLNYIRAHYNRSTQIDPPFFQVLFGYPFHYLDELFSSIGAKVEARRRAEKVYPPKEIHTPGHDDSDRAFREYMADAQERYRNHQMKPGEAFQPDQNGMIQVSGQVAVMMINAILAKDIFDANPDHEFYVEESFPLEWMYPYETPFGVIMKVNRKQLAELSPEVVEKDHRFWSLYSDRLIGNWITYDTPVTNICAFAEKVYLRRDFRGFKGDPKFIRDDDAQKAFSKLRSSQAGLYSWRIQNAKSPAERQRMFNEAVFAYKQAFAYCPYSPEAVYHFVILLISQARFEEALAVAHTCQKLDPGNGQISELIKEVEAMRTSGQVVDLKQAMGEVAKMLNSGQTNQAIAIVDQIANSPSADAAALLQCAQVYVQLGQVAKLEPTLVHLTGLAPTSPEAWYDLAGIRVLLGKRDLALESLTKAIELSNQRLAANPQARNLRDEARKDSRFTLISGTPEFQKLMSGK